MPDGKLKTLIVSQFIIYSLFLIIANFRTPKTAARKHSFKANSGYYETIFFKKGDHIIKSFKIVRNPKGSG